jgi:hypothetical protein
MVAFEIDFRHYWLPGSLRLIVDRNAGSFRLAGDGEAARPIAGLSAFVTAYFEAAARAARKDVANLSRADRQARAIRRGDWMLGLIAAALCVAIWALFFRR